MCSAWLLLVVAVVGGVARGAATHCWEQPSCQDLSSESSMLECVQLCRSDLTAETPMYPGEAHLQPIADTDAPPPLALYPSSPSSEPRGGPGAKRSYSMEHFRWGKPVGRKRRPVKVFTSNGVEEESSEVFPGETRRELAPGGEEQEEEEGLRGGGNDIRVNGEAAHRRLPEVGVGLLLLQRHQEEQEEERKEEKKDGGDGGGAGSYRMNHFRWSGPPASKRYGGFMKSWDERTQKPLLTLFKNVINKDGQQAKRVD